MFKPLVIGSRMELVSKKSLRNNEERIVYASQILDFNDDSIVCALGPAWGMIGTLIGLVNMLKDLQDSSAIGPSMATALLTTLYGSLIANWFCTPIANKLKEQNSIEYQLKEIVIEGLLSIQAGENPRVIEEKLKSFLAPASRNALSTEEGGGEA